MKNPIKQLRYSYFKRKGYSHYHARIAADFWWTHQKDMRLKRDELWYYLDAKSPDISKVKTVAVLGCASKHYVRPYQKLFNKTFGRKVRVDIYDVTTDHLSLPSVVQHDCTKQLPGKVDFIYSHMTLNFLTPAQQIKMLENMHKSLRKYGTAVHLHTKKYPQQSTYTEGRFYEAPKSLHLMAKDNDIIEQSLFW